MRVLYRPLQPIGGDGVPELVGIGTAIPVDGEQIQLVLALQAAGVTVGAEHVEQKAQVEVGIVGGEQGVACQQVGDLTGGLISGDAPLMYILGGDAGEPLDLRRHLLPRGKPDQPVILLRHAAALQHHGGKLDDLVPLKAEPGGLGVKNQDTVIALKQSVQMLHRSASIHFRVRPL